MEEVKLKAKVHEIHHEMHATYGSRRMRAELNAQGYELGRFKTRRVMNSLAYAGGHTHSGKMETCMKAALAKHPGEVLTLEAEIEKGKRCVILVMC